MDSIIENEPSFDLSSISYMNHQARRLEDFSVLETPNPKQSSSVKEDRHGRDAGAGRGTHSTDHSPERPVSRGGSTMREQEVVISELKKECFGLKLRIYYMEEQLRETFDANTEDLLKENIELKVAVEELKNELVYKTDLLTQASKAMQQMSVGEGDDLSMTQQRYDQSLSKMRSDYERKLIEKDERIRNLERDLKKSGKKEKSSTDDKYGKLLKQKQEDEDALKAVINELEATLETKENNIEVLRNDLRRLASNNSNKSTDPANTSNVKCCEACKELESNLADKESALLKVKADLVCETNLLDSYKNKVDTLESNLKEIREIGKEKEKELQASIQQLQEMVKKLRTTIESKDTELRTKEQSLTEIKQQQLVINQSKLEFELNAVRSKDSRILELEIKLKQQGMDLETSIQEHNKTLKEKDDELISLGAKFSEAQQDMERMGLELENYKALTLDLNSSLKKNIDLLNNQKQYTKEDDGVLELKELNTTLMEKYQESANQNIQLKEALANAEKKSKALSSDITDTSINTQDKNVSKEISNKDDETNEVNKLKGSVLRLEEEKAKLQAECDSVASMKKTLEEQLTNKQAEAEQQEKELIGELEEVSSIFYSVVETYKLLLEKLKNNQHPDIQLRIFQHELTQVESTQEEFRTLLHNVLNKFNTNNNKGGGDGEVSEFLSKDRTLKIQLKESRRRNSLLKDQLSTLASSEVLRSSSKLSNRGGEKDATTNEETGHDIDARNKQLLEMREKDEEISTLSRKVKQDKQMIDLITQQKEILGQQLESVQKQRQQQMSSFESAKMKLEVQVNEKTLQLAATNEELKKMNDDKTKLIEQLEQLQQELQQSQDAVQTVEETLAASQTQLSEDEKVVKNMYDMNARMKKKLKVYEMAVKKKDQEKEKLKENVGKLKSRTEELEEVVAERNEEQTELECQLERLQTKMDDHENLQEKYSALMDTNLQLQEKNKQLLTDKQTHENTTVQEMKRLGELVESLTEQSGILSGDLRKAQIEVDRKTSEVLKLQSEVQKGKMEIDTIASVKSRLEGELQEELSKVEVKVEAMRTLEEEMSKRATLYEDKVAECTSLRDTLTQLNNNNDEKEKDITSLQSILQKQLKEIDDKVGECNRLQKEVNNMALENKKLQLEVQKVNAAYDDNRLVDKLTSELVESRSLVNTLQSQVSFCNGMHGELSKLKEEVKRLKQTKMQLKEANRKLMASAEEMSQKLSSSQEENNLKLEEIKILKTQMSYLEEKIEAFTPLYTSSAHNLNVASTDMFTQTDAVVEDKVAVGDANSLIVEHIAEMKQLRKQLEETISNNDALKKQLEERLNEVEHDVSMIQNPDLRVTLVRDNDQLRAQVHKFETNEKKMKTQVQTLKEELEVTIITRQKYVETMEMLKVDQKKHIETIESMKMEKQKDKDTIATLNAQMSDLNGLLNNVKMEMEVYDRLIQQLGIDHREKQQQQKQQQQQRQQTQQPSQEVNSLQPSNDIDKNLLHCLLEEIRDLREQLTLSIDVNNQLREKLERELGYPLAESLKTPKVTRSLFSGALLSLTTNATPDVSVAQNTQSLADYPSLDETPTKDIGISNNTTARALAYSDTQSKMEDAPESFFVIGKASDFKLLKETADTVVERVTYCLKKLKSHKENSVNGVMKDVAYVRKYAKEVVAVLSRLRIGEQGRRKQHQSGVAGAGPSVATTAGNTSATGFDIASKLLKACDTLKTTKGNLQLRTSRPPSRNNSPSH